MMNSSFSSILSADGSDSGELTPPDCLADLYLDQVIAAVTFGHQDEGLEQYFYAPLHDEAAVHYRHEVFRDLERDEVRQPVEDFVTAMGIVQQRLYRSAHLWHPLQQQGWLIHAADAYCSAVESLRNSLADVPMTSRGLRDFSNYLTDYVADSGFQSLVADTNTIQQKLQEVRYTVHIDGLRVHVEKYAEQTDYSAQVLTVFERFVTRQAKDYHIKLKDFPDMNHVEEQILECVAKLYPTQFAQLADYCSRNADFVAPTLTRFDHEIGFYLTYLTFMSRFTGTGLSFSYPDVTSDPGVIDVQGAFDPALAVKLMEEQEPAICNDFQLGGSERIFVVTGPNQGGKTTFARTVGQCLYLASLGCPVAADAARLTLPDRIYTHFERQETLESLHGKLDDELVRIHEILSQATASSVVVMNESFASTTASDALQIGMAVLDRIEALGCIAVYVTFLDELSDLSPACVSMVGEVAQYDVTHRTFRFTRRPADGLAYAAALADKYGLGHEVLVRRITR